MGFCVRLKGNVPPTDNVIAIMTMLSVDEDMFRKSGNVYKTVERKKA